MAMSEQRRRREQYEAERRERDRQQALTIDGDPQKYLATLIAEIDLDAARLARGRPCCWGGHTIEELSRLRACAVAALWRLPLTKSEYEAYPYTGGVVSPGARLLSKVITFQQAIAPWGGGGWDGRVDRARARAVFSVAPDGYGRPWSGYGREYAYTPEELGKRAARAAHAVHQSGVLAVYRRRGAA